MKKILVAIIMVLASLVAVPQPAQAGTACEVLHQCGDFTHYSPDDGFDDAIMATCDWNNKSGAAVWVYEGATANCHDTDGFFVASNRIVKCLAVDSSWVTYRGPTWYKINDVTNIRCVHQLP